MNEIIINSKIKRFKVKFVNDYSFIKKILAIPYCAIIAGENVYKLYKEIVFDKFLKDQLIILNLNEKNKTLSTVTKIYKRLLKMDAKKNLTIVSFGGGVNQDITGFVASTLYRGINWIFVPTTLLAMADSSIGLKTSLNLNNYKNIIGTFYPPQEIIINVDFLKTLEKKYFYSGLGEITKLFLMKKNSFSNLKKIIVTINQLKNSKTKKLIEDVIKESIKIKLDYMNNDEFDMGKRNLLNYGHEFGHALEPVSSFNIPHGTAVLIGIIFANFVSSKRGMLSHGIYNYINKKLLLPNIPKDIIRLDRNYFNRNNLLKNIKKDKKRISEGLTLILPDSKLKLHKIHNLQINEFYEGTEKVKNLLVN